jgi:two-component system response regulator AtoC
MENERQASPKVADPRDPAPASTSDRGSALEHAYPGLVGRGPAMMKVLSLADRAAEVDVPVLLQGESGTGKEVVARALHANGPRAAGPFVPVNCAAIPETLLESELFGHGRGAFTGAHRRRLGTFVRADGGTLFLDEIGDMPALMQAKVLRVLQDREIHPLGGGEARTVDVRLICATNQNLERLVKQGRFREDLFYRINVIRIEMPPLRDRREDLPDLCAALLAPSGKRLAPAALAAIERYAWPGNVRELANVLSRAAVLAGGAQIGADVLHLPEDPLQAVPPSETLRSHLEQAARIHLLDVLRRLQGNRRRAAQVLGIDRTTLYRLIKKYGIEPP